MLSQAVRETFLGLVEANRMQREPAHLDKLCVGLKCGGSDGFSGLSANPAIGHTADLLAALGGRTILSLAQGGLRCWMRGSAAGVGSVPNRTCAENGVIMRMKPPSV